MLFQKHTLPIKLFLLKKKGGGEKKKVDRSRLFFYLALKNKGGGEKHAGDDM